MSTAAPLRIGILGASRIADLSIVRPARATGARLVAIAARDPERAASFAARHGVERAHPSYADVLADPEVEVVYIPLANSLHGPWALRAVQAGKHVLCEKPFAANAAEALQVRAAAERAAVVVIEAFHYPFHPLFRRVQALLDSGVIGEIQHVEAPMRMPAPSADDPRWSLELAGGATMDLGCYSLHCARQLGRYAGGEPRVVSAAASERAGHPGVDERLSVELAYPCGATASVGSDMAYDDGWDFHLTVTGTDGTIYVSDFPRPHEDDTLILRTAERKTVEHLGRRSSYTYQLEGFAAHLREGAPLPYDPGDSVPQMELVDAAYQGAGMRPRATMSVS